MKQASEKFLGEDAGAKADAEGTVWERAGRWGRRGKVSVDPRQPRTTDAQPHRGRTSKPSSQPGARLPPTRPRARMRRPLTRAGASSAMAATRGPSDTPRAACGVSWGTRRHLLAAAHSAVLMQGALWESGPPGPRRAPPAGPRRAGFPLAPLCGRRVNDTSAFSRRGTQDWVFPSQGPVANLRTTASLMNPKQAILPKFLS